MSRIALADNVFEVCPEGEHIFMISKAEQDETGMSVKLTLKTPDGYTIVKTYNLYNSDGELNELAVGTFTLVARRAMKNPVMMSVEPKELKGKLIKAKVEHVEKTSTKTGKLLTFANIKNIETATADEWNAQYTAIQNRQSAASAATASVPAPTPVTEAPKTAAGFDLDALFGRK